MSGNFADQHKLILGASSIVPRMNCGLALPLKSEALAMFACHAFLSYNFNRCVGRAPRST